MTADARLLDSNVVISAINARRADHPRVVARLRELRDDGNIVLLPAIVIAEIRGPLQFWTGDAADEARRIEQFLSGYPLPLPFDHHCVDPYVRLRNELFRTHGTPKKRGFQETRLSELRDRVTDRDLEIDERDLIIASIACARDLLLVTNDRGHGMRRILDAADVLLGRNEPVRLRSGRWSAGP